MKPIVPDKAVIDFVSKVDANRHSKHTNGSPEPNLFHVLQVQEQAPILKRTIPTPSYARQIVSPQKSRVNFYLDQRQQVQLHQPMPSTAYFPQSPGTPRPVTVSSSPREKSSNMASPRQQPVDTTAREHLEARACLLSHRYRLEVNELISARERHRLSVAHLRNQRKATLSPDTTYLQEASRRKTQFLLDHYFSLGHAGQQSSTAQQERVIFEVIDEWALRDNSETQDIESFWKSVTAHLEESHVLQTTIIESRNADPLAVQIALDCIAKVADHLPNYARLLHVIRAVIERALFIEPLHIENDMEVHKKRTLYADRLTECQERLKDLEAKVAELEADRCRDPLDRISAIFSDIKEESTRHELVLQVISHHLPQSKLGMDVLTTATTHTSIPDQIHLIQSIIHQRSLHDMLPVLMTIHSKHMQAIPMFMEDHSDAMDALVLGDGGRSIQRVMEENGHFFADLFIRAPTLLNHAFQVQGPLLGQIVEQNRSAIAQFLAQRQDVMLQLLLNTFKDSSNLLALEEYFVKTPKALRDVLSNRPTLLPGVVKSTPSIFSDLLVNAKAVFGRVVTEVPDHLAAVFSASPACIANIFAISDTLGSILDLCPQALGGYLEKAPDSILDIAHRQPKLVAILFSRFPDLLLEPLEINPTIIATFLATHKEILATIPMHDLNLGSSRYHKLVVAATQTDVMVPMQKQVGNGASKLKKQNNVLMQIVKKRKVNPMAEQELMHEISKLYAKKFTFDEIDDRAGLDRYSLAELTQDIYVQEFGLKSTAQKRIASLVAGLKKIEKDNSRAHWFGILLGASFDMYKAQAIDVFLHALKYMIPTTEVEKRLGDGSVPCLIPLSVAKELAMHAFDSSVPMDVRFQLQKRIVSLPSVCQVIEDVGDINTGETNDFHLFLDIDDVMECVMTMWYEYQTSVDKEMTKLFQEADEDGNGVLTYQEFESMIKKVDATCDGRTIMRMFNMCGEENEQGEHEIKPLDFATVMRTYHMNQTQGQEIVLN